MRRIYTKRGVASVTDARPVRPRSGRDWAVGNLPRGPVDKHGCPVEPERAVAPGSFGASPQYASGVRIAYGAAEQSFSGAYIGHVKCSERYFIGERIALRFTRLNAIFFGLPFYYKFVFYCHDFLELGIVH